MKVPFSWGAVAAPPAPDLADVMSEELQLQSEQLATQLQSKEFGMLQDVLPKEVILAHALKKRATVRTKSLGSRFTRLRL